MRVEFAAAVLASTLFLAPAAPRRAGASWPPFGRAITTAPKGQNHIAIATDGADGAIIAWQDGRSPRVNIFAQHVLASGDHDAPWPIEGRALLTDSVAIAGAAGGQTFPVIVTDGTGGAIVAWQDLRTDSNDFDLFAQHVLAGGVVDAAWPANGRALVALAGQQNGEVIASDEAGGAFVAWQDTRPGSSIADIYAQHVLGTGVVDPRWPVNGLAVCLAAGLQALPVILSDGSGGAIISWEDGRSAVTGDDIFAQHVLNAGEVDPAWPINGRALCAAAGDQGHPTITSDAGTGAIVAWTDSRVVGTAHIFAQHVLGTGVVDPIWPVDGRAISNAAVSEARPLAVSDGVGGAIVNWQGFTVHLNMYVQHVTAAGVVDPAWPAGGRALSDTDRQQSHAAIVVDGAGGAIIAWQDTVDIVAQHVLASGALDPDYPDTGRAVCNLPSVQGNPELVAAGAGGAIASWVDTRNGPVTSPDLFALQVLAAGTLDAPGATPIAFSLGRPIPNPARGAVTLRFALPHPARLRLAIFDVSGRRVRDLVSEVRAAGTDAIVWNRRNESGRLVSAGLYFARLEVEGRALTQKVAIVN